jgi:hypothetical protein
VQLRLATPRKEELDLLAALIACTERMFCDFNKILLKLSTHILYSFISLIYADLFVILVIICHIKTLPPNKWRNVRRTPILWGTCHRES